MLVHIFKKSFFKNKNSIERKNRKLKVKDFPCGEYRAYTLVKTGNKKFEAIQVHSEAVAFEVLQFLS
jgi:hypothetical protein